jgi:hypothetical protein
MSSAPFRAVLVLLVGLGLGIGGEARAGGNVDWSDYLEPPSAHPAKTADSAKPVRTAAKEPTSKAKKASHSTAKKHRAESRAKAKSSSRSGRRR